MHGGTPTTVGKLAGELGLTVEQVLEGCRLTGLSTFGAGTPLDGREADRVRALLTGASAGPPPPPPGAFAAPLPPPPGRPPGVTAPPPLRAPRRWGRPGLGVAGVVAVLAVRVGLRLLLASNDTEESDAASGRFNEIQGGLEVFGEERDDDVVPLDAAPEGTKFVGDLVVGDCWSDPNVSSQAEAAAESQLGVVPVAPCDQRHQAEVFHVDAFVDAPGAPFPGSDRLAIDAEIRCLGAWQGYVGVPLQESVFHFMYVIPTERSWMFDDRSMSCSLYPLDGTLLTTGARGVAR